MDPILLDQTDLWVTKILPFLGPGHYIFVAGVNYKMKELYQEYFSRISAQKIPRVRPAMGALDKGPALRLSFLCLFFFFPKLIFH